MVTETTTETVTTKRQRSESLNSLLFLWKKCVTEVLNVPGNNKTTKILLNTK